MRRFRKVVAKTLERFNAHLSRLQSGPAFITRARFKEKFTDILIEYEKLNRPRS